MSLRLLSSLALWATSLLATAHSAGLPFQRRGLHIPTSSLRSSYDYVIVGAGTAGLTVADRLSADGKTTVLVIENGPLVNSPRIKQIYGGVSATTGRWAYHINSVPQPNLNNRSIVVTVGNLVGGSSAINAKLTIRGTSDDYNRWGSFFGKDSSWSWEGLLPYFKKAINFSPPDDAVAKSANITWDTSYWGNSSTVHAAWPHFEWPAIEPQVEAFEDIPGVDFAPDSGSGKAGVYWFPMFMDPVKIERSYAKTGHFDDIKRKNWKVISDSKVTKILLEDGVATGVSFQHKAGNKTTITNIRANKEVIIAAGAIHSPQLLQISGIGPSSLLESAGIDTIVDLPGVGQNFQDHSIIYSSIIFDNFTTHPNPADLSANQSFAAWAEEVWRANRTGPYSGGSSSVAAWLSMRVIAPDTFEGIASKLENQDYASLLPTGADSTVVAGYESQMKDMAAAVRSPDTTFYNIALGGSNTTSPVVHLHPLSRGTVNINTTDPFDSEPVVDYRALTNPVDLDIMVELLRFTRRFFFETRLRYLAPRQVQPAANVTEPEDLKQFLRGNISPSYFHPVGTCAMLPRELGGVVDEELKVYGVKRLRVVDASIMSVLVGANTCQTTYAIAEKAADLIKADA